MGLCLSGLCHGGLISLGTLKSGRKRVESLYVRVSSYIVIGEPMIVADRRHRVMALTVRFYGFATFY
jgi:hypothetical protein